MPPHVCIYTWPSCTLHELALHVAGSLPGALPSPSIGTRLAFRLVYPNVRHAPPPSSNTPYQPRFLVKDLGSVVVGDGQPGAGNPADDDDDDGVDMNEGGRGPKAGEAAAPSHGADKTLGEAKFVVGDYISCAILPPLSDGSVAPPIAAQPSRTWSGGVGESRSGPPRRDSYGRQENGFGRQYGAGGRREAPGGLYGGSGRDDFPSGEWRRGERLPDPPARPSRGRGRRF